MSRGFAFKEVLLGIGVLVIAGIVLLIVGKNMRQKDSVARDLDRMRHVYMALAEYESDHDASLPPDLGSASSYVGDDLAYKSTGDPFLSTSGPYPIDGSLPDFRKTSPVRISFGYLYSFGLAHQVEPKPWQDQKYDTAVGLIVDEWLGSVSAHNPFHATVSGQVFRLNTDGAVHRIIRPSGELGDGKTLFYAKDAPSTQ